jgi:hypothetical protein
MKPVVSGRFQHVGFFKVGILRRASRTGWAGWLVSIGAAFGVVCGGLSAAAAMTEEQARSIIEPWYRLFNLPVQVA